VNCSRRDLALLLPAVAAAQQPPQKAQKPLLPSKTFAYEEMAVKENGLNKQRAVLNGLTHLGTAVELHLTELGPGQAPHAPHKHTSEELVMLQTGTLEVTIEGKVTRVTPGSVVYVASNEMHGWKNVGADRAQYFVIALGQGQG
jgi:quercetin dioxygenase-like cupin family protein